MNKRRLLKLADLLEADAKNEKGIKFDLANWAAPSGSRGFAAVPDVVPVTCDTTACAVGLACISGAFKRSGLTYTFDHDWTRDVEILVPVFRGAEHFDAVEAFFGIKDDESVFLFLAGSYPKSKTTGAVGERYVAKRIRDFVAGKVGPEY
jgi:hypothetical protein